MSHILERFFIHFAASTFLTLCFFWALRYWARRNEKAAAWISTSIRHVMLLAGLLVFALLPLREPYDVWAGNQVWYKSITDQISWFCGAAVSVWGLYRFYWIARRS